MKIVVAISGASGVKLGIEFAKNLPKGFEKHIILSDSARIVQNLEESEYKIHSNSDIGASIASGSFGVDIVVIIPCSMNTLAKIASGIADI